MKKMRSLTLLTAACMTFTTATAVTLPTSAAIEHSAPTMADQYHVSIDDLKFHRADMGSSTTRLNTNRPLPEGTIVKLMDQNSFGEFRSENGILFEVQYRSYYGYYQLYAQQGGGLFSKYIDTGNTATARILIQYPDGSQEIVTSTITIIPTLLQVNAVTYDDMEITSGDTATLTPSFNSARATGTQFTLVQSEEVTELRATGWEINVDPASGAVTVTALDVKEIAHIPILVKYPDNTSEIITAEFHATPYVEPTPEPEPLPNPWVPEPNNPEPVQPAPVPPAGDRSFGSSSS